MTRSDGPRGAAPALDGKRWTTPADLRGQVLRLWNRGRILASLVTGEALFPKRLTLRRPSAVALRDRFDEARAWATALRSMRQVRLGERESRDRVLGVNTLPHEVWIDTAADALALIGKRREAAVFQGLADVARARVPALLPWLARRPLRALPLAGDWERLLDVVVWLRDHPRPGIYLRQMDVPGVHTKFVETHRGVLAELLDLALPPDSIDSAATGAGGFARRYGFLEKPARIRFRILDPSLAAPYGARQGDFTLDADSFAALDTGAWRAFITENEINFLAFPPMPGGLTIFGAGYGFDTLARARWMESCRLYYWGDIDTHGFAILDELRSHFEHVESFLMDRDTFLAHESLWGTETAALVRDLPRLTAEEDALYDDLRDNRLGTNLRLEQERIGFDRVRNALSSL